MKRKDEWGVHLIQRNIELTLLITKMITFKSNITSNEMPLGAFFANSGGPSYPKERNLSLQIIVIN